MFAGPCPIQIGEESCGLFTPGCYTSIKSGVPPGCYIVALATYDSGATGSFCLTASSSGGSIVLQPVPTLRDVGLKFTKVVCHRVCYRVCHRVCHRVCCAMFLCVSVCVGCHVLDWMYERFCSTTRGSCYTVFAAAVYLCALRAA